MLGEIIKKHRINTIKTDQIIQYGDIHDGAIEFPGKVDQGYVEVGYFYGDIKPKNIIVISSQVGCPSKCSFCELGNEKFVRNLKANEMYEQVILMLQIAKDYNLDINTKHKVSLAKSGDPFFNPETVKALEKIAELEFSFKVSTIFPNTKRAMNIFNNITLFAKDYSEPVQYQISLISTSEEYRSKVTGINLMPFNKIREAGEYWKENNPEGRKINLSLILDNNVPCDVDIIYKTFPPDLFRFRFRNYMPTLHGKEKDLIAIENERLQLIKDQFEDKGYEVGDWATPTNMEQKFGLASNVTLKRYLKMRNLKL
ncbi:hypothetical protein ACFL1H_07940 [Nanoarchaeota archaeon]